MTRYSSAFRLRRPARSGLEGGRPLDSGSLHSAAESGDRPRRGVLQLHQSRRRVRAARRRPLYGVPPVRGPGVVTHRQSATDLSFLPEDAFDVAFASNLVEHLTRPELILTLRSVRRILRPGGRLILMQPNFKYCSSTYPDDYTHIQIFTDASLLDFLEAYGFKVIRSVPRFMPVNVKSTLRLNLPMLPLIVRTYLALPFKPLGGQHLMVSENLKLGPGEP